MSTPLSMNLPLILRAKPPPAYGSAEPLMWARGAGEQSLRTPMEPNFENCYIHRIRDLSSGRRSCGDQQVARHRIPL
jgi:hypothetical protein